MCFVLPIVDHIWTIGRSKLESLPVPVELHDLVPDRLHLRFPLVDQPLDELLVPLQLGAFMQLASGLKCV